MSDDDKKQEKVLEETINEINKEDKIFEELGTEQVKEEFKKDDTKQMENLLKRVHADFENYKKYVEKEKQELFVRANSGLVQRLLPIVDEFEITAEYAKKSSDENMKKGIELLYKNFLSSLVKEGLKEFGAIGDKFDPYLHEAIKHEETDVEEGKICDVLKKGYEFKGQVIRHAIVAVSKGNVK
ncbi:MAG: nucleotide exchange factor GrpE [Candidatus Micrarchaeota archaeon]